MDQLSSFFHLGGYGAYVWPAYGFAALMLLGLLIRTLATLRTNERLLARLQHLPTAGESVTMPPSGGPRHEPAG
jgi:heme exporter protein CcmD